MARSEFPEISASLADSIDDMFNKVTSSTAVLVLLGSLAGCSGSAKSPGLVAGVEKLPSETSFVGRSNVSDVSGPLISRSLTVTATSGNASALSDANYNTQFRSSGTPVRMCWDLSSLPAAKRSNILLVWYSNNTYGYDHTLISQVGYNNLSAYTIDGSTIPGGGAPPTSGFTTLVSVTGNTLKSREHVLTTAEYNWLCLNATESDGSAGNTDVGIQADLYDASLQSTSQGILFVGDSITANAMEHSGSSALNDQIAALGGQNIPYENAGWPGAQSADFHAKLPGWLAKFPGRYVPLSIGTNDAGVAPAAYYANMAQLVRDVQAAGKIAILHTITYSSDTGHTPYIKGLNAVIKQLLTDFPSALEGPDFYAEYKTNPQYIGPDGIHDTDVGAAHRRAMWAAWFAEYIYSVH
ncbi:MAG: SGNH/GDSL hydrolase family protein [Steroidobacteraceae bacterium]